MSNHIFSPRTLLTATFIIVVAIFVAFGFNGFSPQPERANAQSCETVSVSSGDVVSASASALEGQSDGDKDDSNVYFSPYTDDGEYVSQVSYTAAASIDTAGDCFGDPGCAGTAGASGPGGNSVYISKPGDFDTTGKDYSQSESETFKVDYSPDSSDIAVNFSAEASASVEDEPHIHGVQTQSSVSNVKFTVCDESADPGNSSPTAFNDGSTSNRIPVNPDEVIDIDVMANDYDPDNAPEPLEINRASTHSSQSSVSIVDGGTMLRYNPGSLSAGSEDRISYRVDDGKSNDSAHAYLRITEAGNVTADIPEVPESVKDNVQIQPSYNGSTIGQLSVADAAGSGWNVDLAEQPRIFEIQQSDITLNDDRFRYADGRTGDEEPLYITKTFVGPVGDQTGNEYQAELGRHYNLAEDTDYCPIDVTSADVYTFRDNHLQSSGYSGSNEETDATQVNIKPGTYDIHVYTYQPYSPDRPSQEQPHEQSYLSLRDNNGNEITATGYTDDLPDQQAAAEQVTTFSNVQISSRVQKLVGVHAYYHNDSPNSHYFPCVKIE